MGSTKKSPTSKVAKTKKTKSKIEEVEVVEETVAVAVSGTLSPITQDAACFELIPLSRKDIISRLTEKLSLFDANIILDAAVTSAGLVIKPEGQFNKEEARQICLALIKRGGPAYAVGAGLYREMLG